MRLPPDAPDRLLCDLIWFSPDEQVLGLARMQHDLAGQFTTELFQLTEINLYQNGSCLSVTALLNGIDQIGEVRLRYRGRIVPAIFQLPDVEKKEAPSGLVRIEARLELSVDNMAAPETLQIALCDLAGCPLLVQDLDLQQRRHLIRRGPIKGDVIVASQSLEHGLTAVTVALGDLKPPVQMHVYRLGKLAASEHAYVRSARSAPAELITPAKANWVATAIFETTAEQFDIVVQDASGCVGFTNLTPSRSDRIPHFEISNAQLCPETGFILVDGICGFQGVTHVQVMSDDEVILSNSTFLRIDHEGFQRALGCGFHLAGFWHGDPEAELFLAIYCGESCLGRLPIYPLEQVSGQTPVTGPSCHPTHGAAHYRFCAPEPTDTRPWVICVCGMEAWPVTGGGMARTYQMTRFLRRRGYRVLLVAEYPSNRSEDCVVHLRDLVDAVVFVPPMAGRIAINPDYASLRRTNPMLGSVLSILEHIYAPRAVILNFAFNLYAAETLKSHIILDAHDVQHLRAENALKQGADLEDRRCTLFDEVALLSQADTILAIQANEAEILGDLAPSKTVITVPHTLQVDPLAQLPEAETLKHLLFVGQIYQPNIDGLRAFLKIAWPEIQRRHPDVRFHVVGRVCEAFEPKDWPGVEFHYVVPDLDVFYNRCGICINPTNYGTGFKIKTLEGLAHKRVVVSTENGTTGLPEDVPIRVAPLDRFADVICAFIEAPKTAINLARDGAAYIVERFSPDQVYQPLATHLGSLSDPATPKSQNIRLIGYELRGHALALQLAYSSDGARSQPLSLMARFGIGRPIELLTVLPVGASTHEILFPFPVWYRDGKPTKVALAANEQDLGCIHVQSPNAHRGNYLMPNFSVAGLYPDAPVGIVVPEVSNVSIATQQTLFSIYRKNRCEGIAVGPRPELFSQLDQWVAHLFFAPADLPLHTRDPLVFYVGDTSHLVAQLSVEDLRVLRRARIGERLGQARAPHGVWNSDWPMKAQLDVPIQVMGSDLWYRDDSCPTETRLIALVQVTQRTRSLMLQFPAGTAQDAVFRWGMIADTLPEIAHRKLCLTEQGVGLSCFLRSALEPGVHRLDLIGPSSAPELPQSMMLQENLL